MQGATVFRYVLIVAASAALGYFVRETNEPPRAEADSAFVIVDDEQPRAAERPQRADAHPISREELSRLQDRVHALEASLVKAQTVAEAEPLDLQAAITEARTVHESVHRLEAIDHAWSQRHASAVRSELAAAYPELHDVTIDCRTTLCRIDVGHGSDAEAELFRNTPRTDLFRLGAALFPSSPGRSVVYVPRSKGDLPMTLPSDT